MVSIKSCYIFLYCKQHLIEIISLHYGRCFFVVVAAVMSQDNHY